MTKETIQNILMLLVAVLLAVIVGSLLANYVNAKTVDMITKVPVNDCNKCMEECRLICK